MKHPVYVLFTHTPAGSARRQEGRLGPFEEEQAARTVQALIGRPEVNLDSIHVQPTADYWRAQHGQRRAAPAPTDEHVIGLQSRILELEAAVAGARDRLAAALPNVTHSEARREIVAADSALTAALRTQGAV